MGGLPGLTGKSKLAEAISHAINRREILESFRHDGRIELDNNNTVEHAIHSSQALARSHGGLS